MINLQEIATANTQKAADLAAKKRKKSTGATFEDLVRGSADSLKDQGLKLEQHSPRFSGFVGRGGIAKGRLVTKGGLDFAGDLNGASVYFDCKSTKGKNLPLAMLKKHQVDKVRDDHARGAVAFFLVELSECGPVYFALPWPVLKPFWEGQGTGPASIPLATFKAQCPEVARAGKVVDLVGAVKAVMKARDVR